MHLYEHTSELMRTRPSKLQTPSNTACTPTSTADRGRARAVANRLQEGRVMINEMIEDPKAPFGGFKRRGLDASSAWPACRPLPNPARSSADQILADTSEQ